MARNRDDLVFLPTDTVIRGEVELVADHDHLRRVVQEGMLQAKVSLDVSTADFKAMLAPGSVGIGRPVTRSRGRQNEAASIVQHFGELADRGVEVRVLHAGVPSGPTLQQLKLRGRVTHRRGTAPAAGRLTVRRCPRLHAKAVVVDARWLYLGSANLTGAGLGAKGPTRRNFEWGVISRSPALIDAVLERFNSLWEGECCTDCGRREVCPVPLEEPDL